MPKWAQNFFLPKNPKKYIGKGKPRYRSSWEHSFMLFCDNHDSVLQWASESIRVPYIHPFTRKPTTYVPDFLIVYKDKTGNKLTEVVEIKPRNQTVIEGKSTNVRLVQEVAINHAKWNACTAWCKQHGLTFRVLNETDIFKQKGR